MATRKCVGVAPAVVKCVIFLIFLLTPLAAQDVLTFHNDAMRSGIQTKESVLSPSNVNASLFGKTLYFPVNGDVYAQPLYVTQYTMADGKVHDVLFVATQHNVVYAFDAEGNNPPSGYLWQASLLPVGETWVSYKDVNSSDITSDIGITGAPVIDRVGGTLFVVTKSKTTSSPQVFAQRLHALNLADGTEKLNGPTVIQATLPGNATGGATISFDPLRNNQRSALLLVATPGGKTPSSVFITWASHGDNPPCHGWVISYDASANISQQTGAWVDTPNGAMGGIWMSANGLSTDGNGNIFAASGNGTFDANAGGINFGDSLVKLAISPSGLTLTDWFTPISQSTLNTSDDDFGVGGAVLLPPQSGAIPNLLVTADKTGRIYLLNRDNLGHFMTGGNKDVQDFTNGGYAVHSNLVFFNNALYLTPDQGPVESWPFNPSTETFATSPSSTSAHTFSCSGNGCDGGGSNFTISANGVTNGVLWAIDYSNYGKGPAVLYAFDPSNLANVLYTSAQAANNRDQGPTAVKFAAPTIANGFVYVGGRNGVMGYGLFTASAQPAPQPSFSIPAGTYGSAQKVAITSAVPGSTIYYTLDGTTPTISSNLYSSALTISATTVLSAIEIAQGYTTSSVASATYVINSGPGGGAGSVAFGSGFSGGSLALNGSAKFNGSRLSLTDGRPNEVSSAYFPAPLNVQSFVSDFQFQFTKAVADGITFVIQGNGASAIGASTAGAALGYGPDATAGNNGIPKSLAIKFDSYNNQGEGTDSTGLYTNGTVPALPFTDLTPSGVKFLSGDIFHVHVLYNGTNLVMTITDTKTSATTTQSYTVNIPAIVGGNQAYVGFTGASIDGLATQEIISWTYSPQPYFPSGFSGFNLSLNGGSSIKGTNLALTDGGAREGRSAFFTAPVNIQEFSSSFQFQVLNPNADGFTFAIQRFSVTALGGNGAALGYGGSGMHSSVAIKFDLYSNAGEGSDSTGLYTNAAMPTTPAIDLTNTGINFHSGDIFNAQLTYNGTTLTVVITDTVTNASATQSYTINIPGTVGANTAYVGFTAGTGGLSSTQNVLNWTYSN